MNKIVNLIKTNKKLSVIIAGGIALCLVISGVLIASITGSDNADVVYRETMVEFGSLVVGISESGSVDIGTEDQVFELDMSELQRAETGTSSSSNSSGGGMAMAGMGGGNAGGNSRSSSADMFNQMFNMASGGATASTGSIGNLTVEEVCVSVGQQVSEGDILYILEEESVSEIKSELEANVEKAKADLAAVNAEKELSAKQAEYTYKSALEYGTYATAEYNGTIQTLQDAVADAQSALDSASSLLENYKSQLEQTTVDYEAAAQILKNCEWSRDYTDKYDSPGEYVMYYEMAQEAESTANNLEQKKEQLEKSVEQAEKNVENYTRQLASAKRALESGKLSATQTLSLKQLAYSTAQETYDVTMAYLEDSAKDQEEIYAEASTNWEEFSTHIKDNAVCAGTNGVITSVNLAVGDVISTNDTLVTLYDMNEVSMTVSVDEDDMTDIAVGSAANVSFTAYPELIFQSDVTEISDASTDSSGNVTYDVTITLKGDVSGLFQGMTGEITFITKEKRDVLHVSNRAVITKGTKSYVKIKDENGKVKTKEITTGFSDGVNVEIIEGLSEGDVVLIESKVSES